MAIPALSEKLPKWHFLTHAWNCWGLLIAILQNFDWFFDWFRDQCTQVATIKKWNQILMKNHQTIHVPIFGKWFGKQNQSLLWCCVNLLRDLPGAPNISLHKTKLSNMEILSSKIFQKIIKTQHAIVFLKCQKQILSAVWLIRNPIVCHSHSNAFRYWISILVYSLIQVMNLGKYLLFNILLQHLTNNSTQQDCNAYCNVEYPFKNSLMGNKKDFFLNYWLVKQKKGCRIHS